MKSSLHKLPTINFKDKPIIILGVNHSGTRVLVDILSILGSDGGNYKNQWNENEFLLKIHRELVSGSPDVSLGKNIFSTKYYKTNILIHERSKTIEKKIAESLSEEYPLCAEKPWHWKCPSSALFIDFWMKIFPEAYYVHIVRSSLNVAGSLLTRKQFFTIRSAERFCDAMEKKIARVNDGKHKYIKLRYEILEKELSRLLEFLPFLNKCRLNDAINVIKRKSTIWNKDYTLKRNLWIMSVAWRIILTKVVRGVIK